MSNEGDRMLKIKLSGIEARDIDEAKGFVADYFDYEEIINADLGYSDPDLNDVTFTIRESRLRNG